MVFVWWPFAMTYGLFYLVNITRVKQKLCEFKVQEEVVNTSKTWCVLCCTVKSSYGGKRDKIYFIYSSYSSVTKLQFWEARNTAANATVGHTTIQYGLHLEAGGRFPQGMETYNGKTFSKLIVVTQCQKWYGESFKACPGSSEICVSSSNCEWAECSVSWLCHQLQSIAASPASGSVCGCPQQLGP